MPLVAIKIKTGRAYEIYALAENDRCELLDFLNETKRSNPAECSKLLRLFDWTADTGKIRNTEKFKHLRDGIFEFKTRGGIRVACFFDGMKVLILTNGFKKKKDYTDEIERALSLKVRYYNARENDTLTYREDAL